MYYKIENYKTFDGKIHENIEYLYNHVENKLGEKIEDILKEDLKNINYQLKTSILLKLSNINTAKKLQKILNEVLNYGNN